MQRIISLLMSVIMMLSPSLSGLFSGEKTCEDFLEEVRMEFVEKVSENLGISKRVFSVFFEDGTAFKQVKRTVKEIGGKIVGYNSALNEYKVFFNRETGDAESFCSMLQKNDNIVLAVPQIVFNAKSMINKDGGYIPDDPWENGSNETWDEEEPAGSNWHIEAVEANKAWLYLDRMSNIELGVVDSGFAVDHEDLQGKIVFPNRYFEKTNVSDSHGTHVAGIIAANFNNGIGISGICPKATLHCVDWEPEDDSLTQLWFDVERIYTGLIATVKDGAKVINFSLGSDMMGVVTGYAQFVIDVVGMFSSAVMSVLLKKGYDYIVCQAAGNGNDKGYAVNAEHNLNFCAINERNCISELFGVKKSDVLDRVIIVGSATTNGDGNYYQPYYSNVGERVDICAPGEYIYSTVPRKDGTYSRMSGTSMATPIVTAICGLVWSIDSSFSGATVKKIVCSEETAGAVVKATMTKKYEQVNYIDRNLVNAKLAVEKAIEISDSY